MQAACTPVGLRIAMAWSALQRNGSTPSEAKVARFTGGSRADVDATRVVVASVAILADHSEREESEVRG